MKQPLLHASRTKIDKVIRIEQKPSYFKPKGIWYALKKTWLEYCKEELPIKDYLAAYKYFYHISLKYTTFNKPDQNKVLKIRNANQLDQFTFKYGVTDFDGKYLGFIRINWVKVAEDFGGVEVIPLIESRTGFPFWLIGDKLEEDLAKKYRDAGFNVHVGTMLWYDGWDVPGGCVWNPEAIDEMYLVKKGRLCD